MDKAPPIVVIGASAGGVEAIRSLTAALPAAFPAAVFVVLHIGAHKSELPWLLNQTGSLRASHPRDGDLIRAVACCMDPERGCSIPNPVWGQAVRT